MSPDNCATVQMWETSTHLSWDATGWGRSVKALTIRPRSLGLVELLQLANATVKQLSLAVALASCSTVIQLMNEGESSRL